MFSLLRSPRAPSVIYPKESSETEDEDMFTSLAGLEASDLALVESTLNLESKATRLAQIEATTQEHLVQTEAAFQSYLGQNEASQQVFQRKQEAFQHQLLPLFGNTHQANHTIQPHTITIDSVPRHGVQSIGGKSQKKKGRRPRNPNVKTLSSEPFNLAKECSDFFLKLRRLHGK